MRRVWPLMARFKRIFVAAVTAGLASVATTLAVPVVIGRGVDAAAAGQALRPWVLALAGLAVARLVLGFLYRYGVSRCSHGLEADLRNLTFERLTELSFSYWDRTQTGQVISRANSDIRSIQLLFSFGTITAMQFVMLAMGITAMVLLSLPLTLVAMAPLPLVLYLGTKLRDRVFPLTWLMQARMAELATIADENIQGAQIVRTFAQEKAQIALLARSARRLRWAGTTTAAARARFAPAMEALPRLGLALVLLAGGLLAIDGRVAVGDIVAFNAYVLIMAAPFRMIGFLLIQWQRASAAAQRVFEILDETPEITERPDAVALEQPKGQVTFDDVSFAYATGDGAAVLKGFSLRIEAGETVAVVGRTACGKSTIGRLMARFYDTDHGTVRIDGKDVRDVRLSDLRRAVTVVAEEPFLFASSIHDNVALARSDADEASVAVALVDAAAGGFVTAMPQRSATKLGERGVTVSGGQRQRIAIARALVADPAVLVMDDATSAVDATVEQRIHTALRCRRAQRTTVLIAHRLSTIALADRVVFINEGRVAATGRHLDLLHTVPAYAEVLTDIAATDTTRTDATDTTHPTRATTTTPPDTTRTDTTDTASGSAPHIATDTDTGTDTTDTASGSAPHIATDTDTSTDTTDTASGSAPHIATDTDTSTDTTDTASGSAPHIATDTDTGTDTTDTASGSAPHIATDTDTGTDTTDTASGSAPHIATDTDTGTDTTDTASGSAPHIATDTDTDADIATKESEDAPGHGTVMASRPV